tara:strand:- start:2192 stop:2515 length:324 start_codon:yes stop_codon:yes gene_type:complete
MDLTVREKEIAGLIAWGFSEKEISKKLFLAVSTVHTHSKNIRKKIKARSAVDVARIYILANPKRFFTVAMFLFIQSLMVFSVDNYDVKKINSGKRVVKMRAKLKSYV